MVFQLTLSGPLEGVDSFSVLEWHADAGDSFEAGDLLVEIETQKTIVEVRFAVTRRVNVKSPSAAATQVDSTCSPGTPYELRPRCCPAGGAARAFSPKQISLHECNPSRIRVAACYRFWAHVIESTEERR